MNREENLAFSIRTTRERGVMANGFSVEAILCPVSLIVKEFADFPSPSVDNPDTQVVRFGTKPHINVRF